MWSRRCRDLIALPNVRSLDGKRSFPFFFSFFLWRFSGCLYIRLFIPRLSIHSRISLSLSLWRVCDVSMTAPPSWLFICSSVCRSVCRSMSIWTWQARVLLPGHGADVLREHLLWRKDFKDRMTASIFLARRPPERTHWNVCLQFFFSFSLFNT